MVSTSDIFLTDAQIAKRLDMSSMQWEATARALERDGLPRRDPLFQNRRCWPAVYEFFLQRAGAGAASLSMEHYDAFKRSPAPAITEAFRKRRQKPKD